jgi:hypothetical protein
MSETAGGPAEAKPAAEAPSRGEPAMRIDRSSELTTIVLTETEVRLLRFVLERASFIDTPVEEQAAISAFASRALEDLAPRP